MIPFLAAGLFQNQILRNGSYGAYQTETKKQYYKFLIDETKQNTIEKLLLNLHFTSNFLKLDPSCEEFYTKDDQNILLIL